MSSSVAHPDPEALVREYVRRDAAGEFIRSSPWFDGAVDCPGHEPAPDAVTVARNPRIEIKSRGPDTLRALVRWDRASIGDAVVPSLEVDTLVVLRTPFGWRLHSPVLVPHEVVPPPSRPGGSP